MRLLGRIVLGFMKIVFGVVVVLFLAEVLIQFAPESFRCWVEEPEVEVPQVRVPESLYRRRPDGLWTLTPGFKGTMKVGSRLIPLEINGDGIRDVNHEQEKARGRFRVLGLGDEFGFGWGVARSEGFYAQLEGMLDKAAAAPNHYEVINASVPGYGTYEAFEFLKNMGIFYKPDLVILTFYEGDDYTQNAEAPRKGMAVWPGTLSTVSGTSKKAGSTKATDPFKKFVQGSLLLKWMEKTAGGDRPERYFPKDVETTRNLLLEMKRYLDFYDVPMALVYIPIQDETFYERNAAEKSYDKLIRQSKDVFSVRSKIKTFAIEHGILFYELSEIFEDDPRAPSLRQGSDVWGPEGHDRAAFEVFTFLKANGI